MPQLSFESPNNTFGRSVGSDIFAIIFGMTEITVQIFCVSWFKLRRFLAELANEDVHFHPLGLFDINNAFLLAVSEFFFDFFFDFVLF